MNTTDTSSSGNPLDAGALTQTEATGSDLGLTPDAPWLGLRSFTESTRDYFYGRDVEIKALFDRVQYRMLTVLYGQSGLGKTSLLQAGLIPRLRDAGFIPILIRLIHDEKAAGLQKQVVRAITEAIPSIRLSQSATPTLWELFHDPTFGLTAAVNVPVLIIDQFEELFTLGEEKRPEDVRTFLEALACLVENRPPAAICAAIEQNDGLASRFLMRSQPCRVLLALRDDFLSHLERFRQRMPSMMDNRLELRLLSGQQAFRAVYAAGTKRSSEPIVSRETARSIVRFVANATPDAPLEEIANVPPLLSLICERLNARRIARGEQSIDADSLKQSAPDVLREFYNDCFAPHPVAVRVFVEDHLVSPDGYRESKTLDAAISMLSKAGVPRPVPALQKLVDQRLLVVEHRGDAYRVELTHDILSPIAAEARKERDAVQRRQAARRKTQRVLAIVVAVVLVVAAGSLAIREQFIQQRNAILGHELYLSLLTAKAIDVPDKIKRISDFLKWVKPELQQDRSAAEDYHHKLNTSLARIALLPADAVSVDYDFLYSRLLDFVPEASAEPIEFVIIRNALAPHKDDLLDKLWMVTESTDKAATSQRLRAASALAMYDPESPRWARVQDVVSRDLVGASAVHLSIWVESLRPVRETLIAPLSTTYRDSLRDLERSVAADILAKYAEDQPRTLAGLVLDADRTQFGIIYPKFEMFRSEQLQTLIAPINQKLAEIDRDLPPVERESAKEKLANRQANAAIILLKMNRVEQAITVWPLLKHSEDPRTRSYLIHRLDSLGVDSQVVITRLDQEEPDISIRRALLLCLGEFRDEKLGVETRKALLPKLHDLYVTDDDPGIHAALEFVLRRWKDEDWLKQKNQTWAKDESAQEQRLGSILSTVATEKEKSSPRWYVNRHGQTMVVIPGPIAFWMGSPETEIAREDDETLHERSIARTFALATMPVTVDQYQEFEPSYKPRANVVWMEDSPAVLINWYNAALYCNWLSGQEGIPEEQWCYLISKDQDGNIIEASLKENYLSLGGYRLPTEAEMEYATRAGTRTSRFYGETDELLGKYAWFAGNSNRRLQAVGRLKPNDLGLFDVHGNANTWCQEVFRDYPVGTDAVASEDTEAGLIIERTEPRIFRGGSFKDDASLVRSAYRNTIAPNEEYRYIGFRIARTLLPSKPAR